MHRLSGFVVQEAASGLMARHRAKSNPVRLSRHTRARLVADIPERRGLHELPAVALVPRTSHVTAKVTLAGRVVEILFDDARDWTHCQALAEGLAVGGEGGLAVVPRLRDVAGAPDPHPDAASPAVHQAAEPRRALANRAAFSVAIDSAPIAPSSVRSATTRCRRDTDRDGALSNRRV